MTPEELGRLIAAADREALCAALAPLNEGEREALSSVAREYYKQVDNAWSAIVFEKEGRDALVAAADSAFMKLLTTAMYPDWRVPRMAAGLAVLALCGREEYDKPYELSNWLWDDLRDMPQRVLQVLDARRPKWLAIWLAKQWKREQPLTTWFVERGLIRSGALPPNADDAYIRRMAADVSGWQPDSIEISTDHLPVVFNSLEELLLADPDLLQNEVWRLFEVENEAFESYRTWGETLLSLSTKGLLDRRRLLQASVRATGLPFRQSAVSNYGKFHESLSPSLDERAELVDEYLHLLAADQPLAVGYALDALETLAKSKRLAPAPFLAACPSVFRIAKKAQPAKALKLAKLLLKQQPDCAAQVAAAISTGVGHESPDIQQQALELLAGLRDHLADQSRQELSRWTDSVAAANKPLLQALTAGVTAESPRVFTQQRPAEDASAAPPLRTRIAALPASLRSIMGVDGACQAMTDRTDPPIVVLDPKLVPRLDPAQRVVPIESLQELIDVVARVIERVDDVMDLERILDGISRFHATQPADFEQRVGALRKRLEKLSAENTWSVPDVAAGLGLAQLLRAWLGMPPIQREWGHWYNMQGWFFRERTQPLRWRVEGKKAQLPLLALPTHRGGWIDPVALVTRLNSTYDQQHELIDNCDLAQALLRLTPQGRRQALQMLGKASHYNGGAVLRYALGDDVPLQSYGGLWERELRLAAVRARAVIAGDTFQPPLPLGRVSLQDDGTLQVGGPLTEDPALPSDLLTYVFSLNASALPRVALDQRRWVDDWESLAWPLDPRPGLLMGRLNLLFDRDLSWGHEAARLAAFATGAESAEVRMLVTDALIEAIGQWRLDPASVGKFLARHADDLKLNRTAAVLSAVARVSPLHQWAVFRALESFVASLPSIPRDLHTLLTPLLESAAVTGRTLNDEARRVLGLITGSSKSSKLTEQLLALQASDKAMEAARQQACQACVDRAERWQAIFVAESASC
jgi:hypothetical protein